MELLICGSAAAEAIPALFCTCPVCATANELRGKDQRTRAAYQLGDAVRVDFGPDILLHQFMYDLHLDKLRHLFITHSHEDHFYPQTFHYRSPGFTRLADDNVLHVYGNATTIMVMRNTLDAMGTPVSQCHINPIELRTEEPVALAEEGMTVVPLAANHKPNEDAFIFVVQRHDRQMLIANDTGYFPERTWRALTDFALDLVILDCTAGCHDCRDGHLGGQHFLDTVQRMKDEGIAKSDAVFVANHFSHNGGLTHAGLEDLFGPHGIRVGFDGMTLPIGA